MADLAYIIDPGGIPGGRPGINLLVKPDGNEPLTWPSLGPDSLRLPNSNLSAGGFNELMEFSWSSTLDAESYAKLRGLNSAILAAKSQLQQWEVVIYNLVEPFYELSQARTRFAVPGTPIEQTAAGNGWINWKYWIAVQGSLTVEPRQAGSLYQVNFEFTEGLKLVPSMEILGN